MGIDWSDLARGQMKSWEVLREWSGGSLGYGDPEVFGAKNELFLGLFRVAIRSNHAPERDFGAALAKPSPSSHEFDEGSGGS